MVVETTIFSSEIPNSGHHLQRKKMKSKDIKMKLR
jgi:hypothetical protein